MQLPFDTGNFFIPANRSWIDEANSLQNPEMLGDLLRIQTIVQTRCTSPNHPFRILDYFGVPYSRETIGEFVWEAIEDIRIKVFSEMLALTGDEYRLDWSPLTGELCLWYRSRDYRHNATADLAFNIAHTLQTIPDTEIRNSSVHGFGLFAKKTILAGTQLCRLDGQWMDFFDYENLRVRLSGSVGRTQHYWFMEWNYHNGRLLARPMRTSYSFINHSVIANAVVKPTTDGFLSLEACKTIREDDEIFTDYGLEGLPRGYLDNPSAQYLKGTECTRTRLIGGVNNRALILHNLA